MNRRLIQKLGGPGQFVLVPLRIKSSTTTAKIKSNSLNIGLIVLLLFGCMFETSLAQLPQNNHRAGDQTGGDAFGEISDNYMPESSPDNVTAEHPYQRSRPTVVSDKNEGKPHGGDSYIEKSKAGKPNRGDIANHLFNGRGFASKDNETDVLTMNIDLFKDVDPGHLRDLMTSNMSIEDIKDELRAATGATAIQGSLGINEITYPLTNIELSLSTNNSTIVAADVAKLYLKPDDTIDKMVIIGHIKVTVAQTDNGLVGKGELTMNSDEYKGNYTVLLHMKKPPADNLSSALSNLSQPDA